MRKVMLVEFTEGEEFNNTISEVKFFMIGELAKLLSVNPKTIHFYEEEGLLSPHQRGKFKVYTPVDAQRLEAILRMRKFGLTIASIREIFSTSLVDASLPKQDTLELSVLKNQLDVLKKEKEILERVIADMTRLLDD